MRGVSGLRGGEGGAGGHDRRTGPEEPRRSCRPGGSEHDRQEADGDAHGREGPPHPHAPPHSDRSLEEEVRGERECQGQSESDRVERGTRKADTCFGGVHDDRPVPEVDGVRDETEHHEWSEAKHPGDCAVRRAHDRRDQDRDGDGERERSAVVQRGAVGVRERERRHDRGQGRDASRVESALCTPAEGGSADEHEREQDPDEDRVRVGVRAVIRAGRIVGVEETGHQCNGHHRADRRDRRQHAQPASPESETRHAHERPHQVELLFDRQGPQVPERRGCAEEVEVGLLRRDEPPVGDVEETGDPVPAESTEFGGRDLEMGENPDGHQHRDQRREQAPGAAAPEGNELDRLGPAPFQDEQRGDQESTQDEERVDAEKPTREAGLS